MFFLLKLLDMFLWVRPKKRFILDHKTLYRISGRLCYCQAEYPSSSCGVNYRDLALKRISYRFCWILNDNLEEIEEWGSLKEEKGLLSIFFTPKIIPVHPNRSTG